MCIKYLLLALMMYNSFFDNTLSTSCTHILFLLVINKQPRLQRYSKHLYKKYTLCE